MSSPSASDDRGTGKALNRAFQVAYAIFWYYLDIIVMAGVTIGTYTVAPMFYLVGKSWQDVNDFLYETHERFVVFASTYPTGIRLHYYSDFDKITDKKENYLVISNHQVEADYFAMACALEKTGSLNRLRHIMKESLVWLPFVGAFLVNHGSFFINRSKLNWKKWDENADRLANSDTPTSMLIYPEGTTWNNGLEVDGIFEKSDSLARACEREPFNHVMFPKHKGFYRLLTAFRGKLHAVYDVTIGYSSTRGPGGRLPSPGIIPFLSGECPDVHLDLKRIDIDEIPETENEVRDFLIERFEEKNELMDTFFKTGSFPGESKAGPGQSRARTTQSALVAVTAAFLGLTSAGLSILPYFLGLPLFVGYSQVAYEVYCK